MESNAQKIQPYYEILIEPYKDNPNKKFYSVEEICTYLNEKLDNGNIIKFPKNPTFIKDPDNYPAVYDIRIENGKSLRIYNQYEFFNPFFRPEYHRSIPLIRFGSERKIFDIERTGLHIFNLKEISSCPKIGELKRIAEKKYYIHLKENILLSN